MIRNYLVIATRNLLNSKLYSAINILGLSLGIACCLVLTLFVLYEVNFDRFHQQAESIYRVVNSQTDGNHAANFAMTQGILGAELKKHFAEVQAATRVSVSRENITIDGKEMFEASVLAVDPAFFSIFTFPFSISPGNEVLTEKTILISESAAAKLFGRKKATGQTITIAGLVDLKVAGIYRNIPSQSHLKGDYIISFSWKEETDHQALSWASNSYYNYVLLNAGTDPEVFGKKMDAFVHRHTPASWSHFRYFLQPLRAIHMDETYFGNPTPAIGSTMVIATGTVGVIILLLACINYMNMATARSAKRALEVGIRKVMGAYRAQLIRQFLIESFLLCTTSFLLAILWADLTVPFFNSFLNISVFGGDRELHMSDFFADYRLVSALVICNVLIACVAGSYPAFFLSRFVPIAVLKGRQITDASRRLRRALVLSQFTITGILLVVAGIVFRQVDYIYSKDLGFNKDKIVLFGTTLNENTTPDAFKTELLKITGVKQVSSASSLPGRAVSLTDMRIANSGSDVDVKIGGMFVDHDYLSMLEIRLLAGRDFRDNGIDKNSGVIINEQAASAFGWSPEQAIGKRVTGFIFKDSLPGEIIGVVKDYHASSLRRAIYPLALAYETSNNRYMVKLDGANDDAIRQKIDKAVTTLMPGKPFESFIMHDYLEMVYQPEIRTGQLLTFFTVLAFIIGCLGLYALSAYEAEQRIKELGIRKIMGASSLQLLLLLSRNFLKPGFFSFFIAMPLAYFVADLWLQSFPYHTDWSASIFIKSACFIVLVGWITIAAHGIRASALNPADALHHE